MARVLTAQNAVINTTSVQIKTLTAGKQVTLAVFRQLIEEHIFNWATGRLRGVGWGHVRYLIDRPPEAATNLVWQSGDHLRRCIVERRLDPIWRRCLASVRGDPIVIETSQEVWTIRDLPQRVAQYSRPME
jgi:hypothetical protein